MYCILLSARGATARSTILNASAQQRWMRHKQLTRACRRSYPHGSLIRASAMSRPEGVGVLNGKPFRPTRPLRRPARALSSTTAPELLAEAEIVVWPHLAAFAS